MHGTKNNVMAVANNTPKDNEIAIGTNIMVARLEVEISGTKPTKVVAEVRIIGLNLALPAVNTAS
jgi:hypothetical protein